jgi:hypothetical protein
LRPSNVDVPQAKSRGPHQAGDKKYYKRHNRQSIPMEDYEIRDVMRRGTAPDLEVSLKLHGNTSVTPKFRTNREISDPFTLTASVENLADEPALYYSLAIFIDDRLTTALDQDRHGATVSALDFIGSGSGRTFDGHSAARYVRHFATPKDLSVLQGHEYELGRPVSLRLTSSNLEDLY